MDIAREAGAFIARRGWGIVYGGSRNGLMGALADAALAEGGKVTGVIPHFLKNLEVAHAGLTELRMTHTMHERQVDMAALADAFLVLPGGLGTLAEFFEIVTWKQLGLHGKPIAVLNSFGYWDLLLAFLGHTENERFRHSRDKDLFQILEDIQGLGGFLPG